MHRLERMNAERIVCSRFECRPIHEISDAAIDRMCSEIEQDQATSEQVPRMRRSRLIKADDETRLSVELSSDLWNLKWRLVKRKKRKKNDYFQVKLKLSKHFWPEKFGRKIKKSDPKFVEISEDRQMEGQCEQTTSEEKMNRRPFESGN